MLAKNKICFINLSPKNILNENIYLKNLNNNLLNKLYKSQNYNFFHISPKINCRLKNFSMKNKSFISTSNNNFCMYTTNSTVADKKYSFAIVGSGPGGFYSAKQILKKYPNFQIDLYEKLPHPYGLIRTGIAPDHQDSKNVEKDFSELIKNNNNQCGKVNFYGNVNIGKDLSFEDLKSNYSGIIFSYGADDENKLNIQNEDSFGCFSARKFVNWYNGHIKYSENSEFMTHNFNLGNYEDVVIIGNGNVAMDISRILSKDYNALKNFDIPEKILEKLSQNKIHNIHIVARRGIIQSAFTVKELREISRIENVNIYLLREEVENSMNINSEKEMDAESPSDRRQYIRKVDLLKTFNILENEDQINDIRKNKKGKNIFLRFLLTPNKIDTETNDFNFTKVKGIKFLRSSLDGEPNNQTAIVNKSVKKSEYYFETSLILKSIGYKSKNIFPENIKFDNSNNVILNKWGVVYDNKSNLYDNVFACGWVKRGAKGIVDSTLRDSYDTANSINYLLESGKLEPKTPCHKGILDKLAKNNVVLFDNEKWNYIDKIELERGVKLNKIREKIISLDEMKKLIN